MMQEGRENKFPWTKWYWQDYGSDMGLQLSSLAAQGLWMRMLHIMAYSEKFGFLMINGKQIGSKDLAKLVHEPEDSIKQLLDELRENGVYSVDSSGTIYCRRMVREAEISEKRSLAGKISAISKQQTFNKTSTKSQQSLNKTSTNTSTRSVSASVYASEYKNKEEEKGMEKETSKAFLPGWIDFNIWHDYLEMRKKIRKPATLKAQELIIKKLERLKLSGQDPNRVLEQSIENSWQGVFPMKPLDASSGYQKPLRASQTGKNPDIDYPPGYWEKIRELKAKGFEGQVLMAELRKIPDFAEYYKRQKMEHENE